jgi:protein SCO1/2
LETPSASPPLRLLNSRGQPVSLAQYRGKAVLLTFVYTHCPDVCPLMLQKMKATQAELGKRASELQLIAVSTDPKGDTPAAVNRYLSRRGLTGRIQYLVGSRAQLLPVWRKWGVAAQPDPKSPQFINHSSFIFGISASGVRTTLYPANGEVSWMVHDVPLLAKS